MKNNKLFHYVSFTLLIACIVAGGNQLYAHGKKHKPAETDAEKADLAIEYRQGAFHMISFHFDAMKDMLKGKQEYDQTTFAEHAGVVKMLSTLPNYGFPDGSEKGHRVKTKARADIWENRDDFNTRLETFRIEATGLADAAREGNLEAIKPQFNKTGQSCKACHNDYRKK